jgi:hypothetical protein
MKRRREEEEKRARQDAEVREPKIGPLWWVSPIT